jgi:hypothetical protein
MPEPRGACLIVAGASSAAIAVLHLAIVFVGAPGYRYFGAGEAMARQAAAGSWVPAGITILIAIVFIVCAAYGFAGAGLIRRLPLMRAGLVGFAAVYTLRGLSAVPQGLALLAMPGAFPARYFVFSCVALTVGVLYGAGTLAAWSRLSRPADTVALDRRSGGRT